MNQRTDNSDFKIVTWSTQNRLFFHCCFLWRHGVRARDRRGSGASAIVDDTKTVGLLSDQDRPFSSGKEARTMRLETMVSEIEAVSGALNS